MPNRSVVRRESATDAIDVVMMHYAQLEDYQTVSRADLNARNLRKDFSRRGLRNHESTVNEEMATLDRDKESVGPLDILFKEWRIERRHRV